MFSGNLSALILLSSSGVTNILVVSNNMLISSVERLCGFTFTWSSASSVNETVSTCALAALTSALALTLASVYHKLILPPEGAPSCISPVTKVTALASDLPVVSPKV